MEPATKEQVDRLIELQQRETRLHKLNAAVNLIALALTLFGVSLVGRCKRGK